MKLYSGPERRAVERRDSVRFVGSASFRDSGEPPVETPKRAVPEWVRRAKAGELPVKRFLP